MATQNRAALKGYFNTGDRPNEAQFTDLIDSSIHKTEDLATTAEVQTGTNNAKFVTPAGAKASVLKWAPVKTVNGITPNSTTGDVALGLEDTGWQAVNTFNTANGITSFGTANTVRYRKKNGVVFLDGLVKGGVSQTAGSSYLLFQLPVGYRPDRRMLFNVYKAETGTSLSLGRIDIESNGMVYGTLYSAYYTNLTGIFFPIGT